MHAMKTYYNDTYILLRPINNHRVLFLHFRLQRVCSGTDVVYNILYTRGPIYASYAMHKIHNIIILVVRGILCFMRKPYSYVSRKWRLWLHQFVLLNYNIYILHYMLSFFIYITTQWYQSCGVLISVDYCLYTTISQMKTAMLQSAVKLM